MQQHSNTWQQLLPLRHLKCCYAASVKRIINSMILKLLPQQHMAITWQHMATTVAMTTSKCCYAAAVIRIIISMILKLLPWQHIAKTWQQHGNTCQQLLPWRHLKCCYAAPVIRIINSMILKLLPRQHMATHGDNCCHGVI